MVRTDRYKTMLEIMGFEDVSLVESKLPKHIIEWARGDDPELTDDEVSEVIPYFMVATKQGSFGIALAVFNMIDLKNTGFNALDLGEPDADEDFYLASLNTVSLEHLRRLMTEKKKLQKNMN